MLAAADASFELAEIARRLANVVRIGTVAQLDLPNARLRASYGIDDAGRPVLTGWLPWLTARAGADRSWWAPTAGEQVILLAPSGDLAQAAALPAIYSDAAPAPSDDAGKYRIDFADGGYIEHDPVSGDVTIRAVGSVWLRGADEALEIV